MDVIETAYKALEPIRERGIQVQEGWYDEHYKNLHITLWPLTETPEASSDDGLEVETAGLQVTIFSTTACARRSSSCWWEPGRHTRGQTNSKQGSRREYISARYGFCFMKKGANNGRRKNHCAQPLLRLA